MTLTISVITPSFNQAEFLPRTLASVSSQTLRPIEHLIFDPGSTDDSRKIAAAAPGVTLIAEPDKGQADAVANGMLRAKGDIVAWINSDDEYADPEVFAAVAAAFESDEKPDIVFGDGDYVGRDGEFLRKAYVIPTPAELPWRLAKEVGILQPATFISKALIKRIGPVDRDLQFCMDYEFWIRAQQSGAKFLRLDRPLAKARYYADNKTLGQRAESFKEVITMVKTRFGFVHTEWIRRLADYELNKHDGILRSFANSPNDTVALEAETKRLSRKINGDFNTVERIKALTGSKLLGDRNSTLLSDAGPHAGVYLRRLSAAASTPPHTQTYTVGPQRWAFDKTWLNAELTRSDALIERLAVERTSDICVLVGNGPSLKATDLDCLKGADVFITNYAFLERKLASLARYLCVTNYLVAEQAPESFNLISNMVKFAPYWLSYCLLPTDETCYIRAVGHAEFGLDYRVNISWRSTVSFFAMQIAYALGYRKVALVGFDHSYVQPKSNEGDLIDQKEDDPNHFDNRYFKGKVWQAADTDNMEAMYRLAKAAFEQDGREIVNCTVGGKLELFRRGELTTELAGAPERPKHPRVLLIDHTRNGNATATGELKAALFADWPGDKLLQISDGGGGKVAIGGKTEARLLDPTSSAAMLEIDQKVANFRPDIILYRPVPRTAALHSVAMKTISASALPLATWIMDDWPTALAAEDPRSFAELDGDWRRLLARSRLNLGIGEAMTESFERRYDQAFRHLANGVAPDDWPVAKLRGANGQFRVRYAGGLAENMTLSSLRLVAEAVEALATDGLDIVFEIKTRALWRRLAEPRFKGLERTTFIVADLSPEQYRAWLAEADLVVIGYNFDEVSKNYIRYSVANKLPECLACGAPLLAVGPRDVVTMVQLEALDCGVRITRNDAGLVKEAIRQLASAPEERLALAQKAQRVAFSRFDIRKIRATFQGFLSEAAFADLTSGVARAAHANVDETAAVARLLDARRGPHHVMLDIGARFGLAAGYFHQLGWTIHCFEPDGANRAKLTERFANAANVSIDPRALSERAASNVSVFTSEQSTGISGLHAFHTSHKESGGVDVVSVADVVAERGVDRVDFLKIDVEGFDYSLLKGVPWDRLKPDVIECGFEDAKTVPLGHTWKDIATFLRDQGYAIYLSEWHPIVGYGVRHDWRRIIPLDAADVPQNAWGNILAFRDDPGLPAIRAAFKDVMQPLANLITAPRPTPGVAAEPRPPGMRFYAPYAERLRTQAPRVFTLLRFGKKMAGSLWRRRVVAVPAFALLAAWMLAGFLPALASWRWIVWGTGAFAFLFAAIGYIALRVHQFMERSSGEVFVLRQSLNLTREELRRANVKIASLTKGQTQASAITAKNTTAIAAVQAQANTLAGNLGAQANTLKVQSQRLEAQSKVLEAHANGLSKVTATVAANASAQAKEASAMAARVEALGKKTAWDIAVQAQQIERTDKFATFNNATWYQRFNRRLSQEHVQALSRWTDDLPMKVTQHMIGYAADRACRVESRMHGRLATSIENILLRTYAAMSVKRRSLDILEIGTLFGIGAGIMYDAIAPHFDDVHVTLLDPLDGYYEAKKLDILTGLPISEATLRKNLQEVGLTDANLTLIKHLSSDAEALELARKRRYDVLVIDGDHTYTGVKTDFDLYAPMVRQGGVIIFDDYGAEDWPDVQKYVDDEVEPLDFVERVGHEWRTCIYRVK